MAHDAGTVLKKAYDATTQRLETQTAGAASPAAYSSLSAKQILKRVFDASTGKIRVVFV